jgi:hypothetical protein
MVKSKKKRGVGDFCVQNEHIENSSKFYLDIK